MLTSLFRGFNRALNDGLAAQTTLLDQRLRLTDTAHRDRTRRRLATRTARLKRRGLERDDQLAVDRLRAGAAGSGLHLAASAKTSALLGESAIRAGRTAQATSVLSEALADRLSRAALRRQRRLFAAK